MTVTASDPVPFAAHVALLELFVRERRTIVASIQALLNAQRQPDHYLQDRSLLSRLLEDCFFALPLSDEQSQLRGQLQAAHWSSGFRPRRMAGLHNDLIDPAELMIRGFFCWQQTRWPGRNGRTRYAQTLFNLTMLRYLELLSMRLWDGGAAAAGDRIAGIQAVLDQLWRGSPPDQPVLVRDARWLIPLAQSPTTDELGAYLEVAERIAESAAGADRIEIQRAHVLMIGGHLRSQIRHYCLREGLSVNAPGVVVRTRTSNALDYALLIQGLVSLLEAYEQAVRIGDSVQRRELADAICQGISPDPELFVNRVELAGAYSMIEHLFVTADGDYQPAYTPMGERHLKLLQRFRASITRLAPSLLDDCAGARPVDGAYSPYGVIYGTPTNLTENVALKTLTPDASTRFSLEDVFAAGDADKLDWVNGWRRLPHIDRETQQRFSYPHEFAAEIFGRLEQALGRSAAARDASDAGAPRRSGRLFIVPAAGRPESTRPDDARSDDARSDDARPDDARRDDARRDDARPDNARREDARPEASPAANPDIAATPALAARYFVTSDPELAASGRACACDETQLLRDRLEGHFAVSCRSAGGWLAIRKDFLTEVIAAGQDVQIAGLPANAAGVLRLMCPDLVTPAPAPDDQASVPPSIVKA